ncbi:MAG: class I SAM-dependent methyltransferase [Opitutaceae bacterium]
MNSAANFDPLVRSYRALEWLAFGHDLERTRFCLLDRLADRSSILVLGEGDGRALARLVTLAPTARIHCLDSSAAMLTRAQARLAGSDALSRVTFEQADALTYEFKPAHYDAVVTLFFLDCFTAEQAPALVDRISVALQPNATWLFADFVLPARGIARVRAKAWLSLLYTFFRWSTGLRTRALPPSETLIHAAGFHCEITRDFQHGLLRSAFFRRP